MGQQLKLSNYLIFYNLLAFISQDYLVSREKRGEKKIFDG